MANYFSTWKISRDSRRPRCPSPGRILPEMWNISCTKTWTICSEVVIRNFTMQPPFTLPLVSLMPKLKNKETSEPLIIGAHLSIAKSPPAIVGLRIGWLKSSVLKNGNYLICWDWSDGWCVRWLALSREGWSTLYCLVFGDLIFCFSLVCFILYFVFHSWWQALESWWFTSWWPTFNWCKLISALSEMAMMKLNKIKYIEDKIYRR